MDIKQERIDQINEQLDKLYEEKRSLELQIAAEGAAAHLARVRSWGLSDSSALILFAKSESGYHWDIAKTLKITELDIQHQFIDAIESTYHEADYEYFVNVKNKRICFSSLADIEEEFNIYIVDDAQLSLLNRYFCELKLTYSNYVDYEKEFAKNAVMSIKIPV